MWAIHNRKKLNFGLIASARVRFVDNLPSLLSLWGRIAPGEVDPGFDTQRCWIEHKVTRGAACSAVVRCGSVTRSVNDNQGKWL